MIQIGKKFKDSHWKAVAKVEENYEELALPQLTICPSKPYKEGSGNMLLSEEYFFANTYEEGEMIVDTSLPATIQEQVRSWNKGRCFAIDFETSKNISWIILNKGLDYHLYLGTKNTNFWLNFDKQSKHIFQLTLKASDFDNQALIKLTKEIHTDLENCDQSSSASFDQCSKDAIIEKFNTDLSCKPVTLEHLGLTPDTCQDENQVQEAMENIENIVNADHGCLKRCTWENYSGYIEYSMDTSENSTNGELKIKLGFQSTLVDHFKEFYIYDSIDMVMAVGGILAFFLGFSLLSVLLDCVDVISRACGHADDTKLYLKRTFRQ